MGTINRKNRITRRGFLELSSAALATTGLLGNANAAKAMPDPGDATDRVKPDSAVLTGKIALEEHFALPETDLASSLGYTLATPELGLQIQDSRHRQWTHRGDGPRWCGTLHPLAGLTWGPGHS